VQRIPRQSTSKCSRIDSSTQNTIYREQNEQDGFRISGISNEECRDIRYRWAIDGEQHRLIGNRNRYRDNEF